MQGFINTYNQVVKRGDLGLFLFRKENTSSNERRCLICGVTRIFAV